MSAKTVNPDTAPEKLQQWLEQVEFRCPVQDNLVHPTPVLVSLHKLGPAIL